MRVPRVLQRLDDRMLPPVGRVLARLARGGRRVRIVRGVAVVGSLSLVLVAVYVAGRPSAPDDAPSGAIVYLGVAAGASIPQYVATSNNKLQTLIADSATVANPPPFFALVSFSAYLSPPQLTPLLTGLDIRVTNVIMRLPSDKQTQIIKIDAESIPDDVVRDMLSTATAKTKEVADFLTLLSKVKGTTADDETLRETYMQGAAVSQAEATSYRRLCGCVYAAVVYATPKTLGKLAAMPGVRTVEPAPRRQLLDRVVFWPPFPDQHDLAEPPGVDPSGSATASSGPTASPSGPAG